MTVTSEIDWTAFPDAPSIRANWFPVYLEPMAGSGERFTVAVGCVDSKGEFVLRQTFTNRQALCMYGAFGAQFSGLVDVALGSLSDHLSLHKAIDRWKSPFDRAVTLGVTREGLGRTLAEIADDAMRLTSSLGAGLSYEPQSAALQKAEQRSVTDDDSAHWERQIKASVLGTPVDWADRFGRNVRTSPRAAPTRIGYLGNRIAANFDRLVPGTQLARARDRAKARLLNLQILRDSFDGLAPRPFYELMLWSPDDPQHEMRTISEAFNELEDFGDRHDIRVIQLRSSKEAARRIFKAESVQ